LKNKIYIIGLLCTLQSVSVFSWNALGHRLVAQIAYEHTTPHARQAFNQYNTAMDIIYKPQGWVDAAVWLDILRYQDVNWFVTMHYIDFPFSNDDSSLPSPQEINALWAIEKARNLLLNKYATNFDKGIAFRVILHVVGDIHQPLHAATRVSSHFPEGDRGGNLVSLRGTRIAKNLHAYWDRGGGLLITKRRDSQAQIAKRAANIERRWPCLLTDIEVTPELWAKESHVLAVNTAYKALPIDNTPDTRYQRLTKKTAERQIALAGCRLSALLNQIDEALARKKI
jgi:hypothetical protein